MAIASIEKLTTQLSRLPGVGHKTAQRLAYHLLSVPKEQATELAEAITAAREKVHPCPVCGAFTDRDTCEICSDPKRTEETVCVVSDARDVLSMEKTREFHGHYHVLNGSLSPMNGIGPGALRINALLERCKTGQVREVILATNPDVEGEATASYIAKLLKPLGITTSRIAHGIPIGGNLEYTDEVTLAKALEGRRIL
ncbi:MAG: recombination protein RecR [Clostridia bacterium]|jgi:recombination protein RecR|nr:recombination protein RecR [Clostridia bacterium]MBQ6077774.1 recombination protein RecR [Clostridia bacterium]MBR0436371.1 recombination protein RecR [Clostridia bacterium]MBR2644206.1 recombination protein RecR [Clostridia bacterium]MBR3038155.1 recombination protein RecR [Clostridia bacterium]